MMEGQAKGEGTLAFGFNFNHGLQPASPLSFVWNLTFAISKDKIY